MNSGVKILSRVVFFTLVLYQSEASANAQCPMLQTCDSCMSEASWQSAAIDFAPDVPASGGSVVCDVYLANMNNGSFRKFQVLKASEPGFYHESAAEQDVESEKYENFSDYYNLLAQWNSSPQWITLPPGESPVDSGYDIPGNSQNQVALGHYLEDNHTLTSILFGTLQTISDGYDIIGFGFSEFLRIRITFPDGSTGVFEIEFQALNAGSWEPVEGTFYDADNNKIFFDGDDYNGQSGSTSGGTTLNLLDRLRLSGFIITRTGDSLECTWECTGDHCNLNCS